MEPEEYKKSMRKMCNHMRKIGKELTLHCDRLKNNPDLSNNFFKFTKIEKDSIIKYQDKIFSILEEKDHKCKTVNCACYVYACLDAIYQLLIIKSL